MYPKYGIYLFPISAIKPKPAVEANLVRAF